MKCAVRNGFILLICVALTALALSALLLPCHHCEGEGCPVCLAVDRAMRLAEAAAASLAAGAATVLILCARRAGGRTNAHPVAFSLVAIEAELLS